MCLAGLVEGEFTRRSVNPNDVIPAKAGTQYSGLSIRAAFADLVSHQDRTDFAGGILSTVGPGFRRDECVREDALSAW